MKNYILLAVLVLALGAGFFFVWAGQPLGGGVVSSSPLKEKSIYEFVMKGIDGADVNMEQYRGKVLLIVNVASECGYTPQYEGLQKVYTKYKDQNFLILGFPANNFGAQEPGT